MVIEKLLEIYWIFLCNNIKCEKFFLNFGSE